MSSGYSIDRVRPGDWLQAITPGGFSDAVTGVHIPGPIVQVDELRRPTKIVSMPEPIQLFGKRQIQERDRDGKIQTIEVPFDHADDRNGDLCDALNLAVACGIVRIVGQDEMKKRFPHLLEKSNPDRLYTTERKAASMAELLDEYYDAAQRSNELAADAAAARREADAALNGKSR